MQPRLRNRPVAVVPVLTDSTSCIAACYRAKARGVKVEYHHRLIEAVESCIPVTKVLSIDEMTCELFGNERTRERSTLLARQIKEAIAQKVGAYLKCSVGIAPNTFLAKTATELEKPDGLVVIEHADLPHCLHSLEVRDLCGIGARMERRLYLQGITTVPQLCAASRERLHRVWGGVEGDRMYANLRGEVVTRPETHRASVGHSHVLPPAQRSEEGARATLCRLLQKAATRLRRLEYSAAGMHLYIKYLGRFYWSDKIKFSTTTDTMAFTEALLTLWKRRPREGSTPLAVGVALVSLTPAKECNLCLFDLPETRRALYQSVDSLNERFGTMKIYLGGAHLARSTQAPPIAFGFIPELMKEPRKRSEPLDIPSS